MVTTDKVDRISKALDEQKRALDDLSLKQVRPALGRGGGRAAVGAQNAFDAYVRRGDDRLLRALDTKAMSYGSGQDGGYLVPEETDRDRQASGANLADPRYCLGAAGVSAVLKKPFSITGRPAAGWRDRRAAADEFATLAELQFPTMELYAMPAATQALLDDTVVDLDQWIRPRWKRPLPNRKGMPSLAAMASTSRRAS